MINVSYRSALLQISRNYCYNCIMITPIEQLENSLKTANQSITEPRRVVFNALQGKEPQTMHQLVAACAGVINRASVYRTVTLFERLGIVQRLQIGWKYKLELSDSFHHHHHHLTCLKCGITSALHEDMELELRLAHLARQYSFSMQDHQLEIQGYCMQCQTLMA